jgi:hypothetical protein
MANVLDVSVDEFLSSLVTADDIAEDELETVQFSVAW